jgi:hypothetical protein
MSSMDKPHSRHEHVYALVRFDLPVNQTTPENSVAVVKVLCSRELAQQELVRLNERNGDKGCRYVSYTSRLIPMGMQ